MSITAANVTTAMAPLIELRWSAGAAKLTPHIILAQNLAQTGDELLISVDEFVARFGSAGGMTHAELIAVDPEGKMGYGQFIDDWKAKGYIT